MELGEHGVEAFSEFRGSLREALQLEINSEKMQDIPLLTDEIKGWVDGWIC